MELIEAAKNGDFTRAFNLLQQGYRPDIRDHDNATPLYWSACHGYVTLCEVLLQARSDVNARVKWGSTPLHAASDRGHYSCVTILIENGADVNCQNNRGDTALHIAAYRGNLEISLALLRANTDKSLQNDKGKTPQDEAMEGGHSDIADAITRFTSGDRSTYGPPTTQVPNIAPFANLGTHAPLPVETTNGVYDRTVFPSYGSDMPSGLTESICSSGDSLQSTSTYDYTDSSNVTSVPEFSCVRNIPIPLTRSVSVGGHEPSKPVKQMPARLPHPVVAKTNSVGNIFFSGYTNRIVSQNDMNNGYSSMENIGVELSSRVSRVKPCETVSHYSTKLTSNGRCVATESVDDSAIVHEQGSREEIPEVSSHNTIQNRPLRASTGSVYNPTSLSENQENFIKILQKQLVNAYKDTERLGSEKEDLNFKCSTVLKRLTDTEQQLEDKTRECENLREIVNANRTQAAEAYVFGQNVSTAITTGCSEGLNALVVKLNDKLSDVKHFEKILQENLLILSRNGNLSQEVLSEPGTREWVPGKDYVIIGEKQAPYLHPSSSCSVPLSVKFAIKHLKTGRRLSLKMLLLLESPIATQWVFKSVPLPMERNIPKRVLSHSNISATVHKFEGSTERFKKFVIASESKPVQLCSRTAFIVTEEAKTFRTLRESINRSRDSENRSMFEYGLFMEFMLQTTYQLLSLVCAFEGNKVFHGNISEDTVIFDKTLKPQLSDLDLNQCSFGCLATNVNNEQSVRDGCSKLVNKCSDDLSVVCELLQRAMCPGDHVTYTKNCDVTLRHKVTAVHQVLQKVANSAIGANISAKTVLNWVGCILFVPRELKCRQEKDCAVFIQTQLLRLTSQFPSKRLSTPISDFLSVPESVALRRPEVEWSFLCSISSEELWDVYQRCRDEGWIPS